MNVVCRYKKIIGIKLDCENTKRGEIFQAVVKKWFREKEYGFLDNGAGSDIMIRKIDLVRCQFLKVGTTVEFECHPDKGGLIAKNVRLIRQSSGEQKVGGNRNKNGRPRFIGVMA